jgi:hypothetical protein
MFFAGFFVSLHHLHDAGKSADKGTFDRQGANLSITHLFLTRR